MMKVYELIDYIERLKHEIQFLEQKAIYDYNKEDDEKQIKKTILLNHLLRIDLSDDLFD